MPPMIVGLPPHLDLVLDTLLLRAAQAVYIVHLRTFTPPDLLTRARSVSANHARRRRLRRVASDRHLLLAISSLSHERQMMMAENRARMHLRLITRPASLPLIIHHTFRFPLLHSSSGQSLPHNMKWRLLVIQAVLDHSVLAWHPCIRCSVATPTNVTL